MKNNTTEQESNVIEQLKEMLLERMDMDEGKPGCPCPICHIKRMAKVGTLEKKQAFSYLNEMMGLDTFLCNIHDGLGNVTGRIQSLATFLREQGFEKDADTVDLFLKTSKELASRAETFLVNEKNEAEAQKPQSPAEAAKSFGINIAG